MTEEEFKRYYALLSEKIFAYASSRLHMDQAKDIVSDTFETVWRKLEEAPSDAEACAAWIFATAKFKILQELQRIRRKHHDNRFIDDCAPPHPVDPDVADVVADNELAAIAYGSLRHRERELFDLLFIAGLDRKQVRATLGLSVSALESRISRLRKRLETLERDLTGTTPTILKNVTTPQEA